MAAPTKLSKEDAAQMRALKKAAKEYVADGLTPSAALRAAIEDEIEATEREVESVRAQATPKQLEKPAAA